MSAPMRRAVVALGANLGDREATLASALDALDAHPEVAVVARSALFDTVAWRPDGLDHSAPRYLNAVALVDTTLDALGLLAVAQDIERRHGRERRERWGDRTLDIDLVDVDGLVVDSPELTLPHPRAHERDFVLAPWLDVDAEATIVGRGRVADLLAAQRELSALRSATGDDS